MLITARIKIAFKIPKDLVVIFDVICSEFYIKFLLWIIVNNNWKGLLLGKKVGTDSEDYLNQINEIMKWNHEIKLSS